MRYRCFDFMKMGYRYLWKLKIGFSLKIYGCYAGIFYRSFVSFDLFVIGIDFVYEFDQDDYVCDGEWLLVMELNYYFDFELHYYFDLIRLYVLLEIRWWW